MVNFPELRDSEPHVFTREAQKWADLSTALAARSKDLDKHIGTLAEWEGTAGDTARQNLTEQRKKIDDANKVIGKIPEVLTKLGTRLDKDKTQLVHAMGTATDNSLQIHQDGTVVSQGSTITEPGQQPTPNPMPGPSPQPNPPNHEQLQQLANQLTGTIKAALADATQADQQAASELRSLTAQAAGLAPAGNDSTLTAGGASIPGPNTSPADVAKWWNSLTPQQQESLLFMHPDQIGGLDGVPVSVRDRVNRSVLAEQRAKLLEEQARRKDDPNVDGGSFGNVDGKLKGIDAVQHRLDHPVNGQRAYLMKISGDGNGRAIVAMGDPDTATNVATYVPGTGSGLPKVSGDLNRSDAMLLSAQKAGSPATSVITWIGYDAPPTIPSANDGKWADGGKADLQHFQDGLRATHDGPRSHNTVVGHSYGTTVVGHAARDGSLNADDIVNVASPGVGVTHAKDLHLTGVPQGQVGQHVHSTVAQHDPIDLDLSAPKLGPPPTGASFGGSTFTSDPGKSGHWWELGWNPDAHSRYWDPGNKALTNMGNVIAGKPTF